MQATAVAGGVSLCLTGSPDQFAVLLKQLKSHGEEEPRLGLPEVRGVQFRQSEPERLQEVQRTQAFVCGGRPAGEGLDVCRMCRMELRPERLMPKMRPEEADDTGVEASAVGEQATGDAATFGAPAGGGCCGGARLAGAKDALEVTFPEGNSSQADGLPPGFQDPEPQVPESCSEPQPGAGSAERAKGTAQEGQERAEGEPWTGCEGGTQKQEPHSSEPADDPFPVVEYGGVQGGGAGLLENARPDGRGVGGSHTAEGVHFCTPPQAGVGNQGEEGESPRLVGTPPRAGFDDFAVGDLLDHGARTPSIYGDDTNSDWCKEEWPWLSMQAGMAIPLAGHHATPMWPSYPALIGGESSEAPSSADDLSSASSEAVVSQLGTMIGNSSIDRVGNGSGGGPGPGCLVQVAVATTVADAAVNDIRARAFDILLGDGATSQEVISVIAQIEDVPMSHEKYGTLLKMREALGKILQSPAVAPSRASRRNHKSKK